MNNPLRKLLPHFTLPVLLAIFGLFFSTRLQASHIIGGEMRYECLGGNQYKIILDVYRDCFYGIPPFDAPAHIGIYTESGLFVNNMNLQHMPIDTVPNNIAGDPCLFVPTDVCVEHARYEGIVTLNQPTGGYYFVYQRCCRNATINNIVNPAETGATYFVHLTQAARNVCNDSPDFDDSPPVFVCVNKPIQHPNAAIDQDGDSLVYKFYVPYAGASFNNPQPGIPPPPPYVELTWAPGYGLTNLLGGTDPLTINPQTGLIEGTPMAQGQFVVGVMVEEYRNGVLLSRIRRDFQYNVGTCGEIISTIIAPAAQCENLTVHFQNNTQITDDFIWYFNYPATFPSSTQEELFFTYPDTGSYVVALIAAPGSQCVDTAFHEIFLQKNSLAANFNLQNYECSNQSVLVLQDLSTDNVSPPVQWTWTVSYGGNTQTSTLQNPTFVVPNPSVGTIKLVVKSQNGCVQEKTIVFDASNGIDPDDVIPSTVNVCLGSSVGLNPNGIGSPFTYQWSVQVPAGQQNAVNPIVSPTVNTTYSVTITAFNGLCVSTKTVTALVSALPVLNFVADADCNGKVVHFINQSLNVPLGYAWDFGDPSTNLDKSTLPNPTYTYPNYGTYTVTLSTAAANVCQKTITQSVTVSEKILQADFGFDYVTCGENAVTILFFDQTVNNQNNTEEWEWEFTGPYFGSSSVQNPVITVASEGILNVKLTVTTDENCVSTTPAVGSSFFVDLPSLPGVNDGSSVLGCLNGGVTLNPGGNPNYIYNWSPAAGLSCTTCPSPFANPSQTTTYTVNVQHLTADTCDFSKSLTVTVPTNVGLVASPDVQSCNPTATLTASTILSPVTLTWTNEAGQQVGTGTSVTVPISGYETYLVKAVDQFGCPYFDPVKVVGGPVNISTNGEQIKCSNELADVSATNLDPNDTLTWQWSPAGSFNGSVTVPDPDLIQTIGQQWVTVNAVNQFGCQKLDSTFVAIVDVNAALDFESLVECSGSVVQFTNTSQNAYGYVWDFGDPTTDQDTSTAENPTWVYVQDGTYEVTLDLIFDVSCVTPVSHEVTIAEPVFTPDFTFEYLECDPDSIEVQFHDATSSNLLTPNIWNWTTSNGDISSLPDPIFTVHEGDEFVVTMEVGAENGCEGEVTKTLKLEFIEVAFGDSMVLCKGDTAGINPFGNTSYEYHWTPNIFMDDPNLPNPQVHPPVTTTYSVNITNFSPDTCSIVRSITVYVPEKIEVAAAGDTLTCGEPVTLTGSSNIPQTTYEWTAEAGGGVVGNQAVLEILPSVDTWFKVVGEDQYACRDSAEIFVRNETVETALSNPGDECPESEIPLTVTNSVPDHDLIYDWSATLPGQILPPGNGSTVTILTAPAEQTATYSVTVTNQYGCTSAHSQVVESYEFVPTVVPDLNVCPGVAEALNPHPDLNVSLTYQWSPGTGLSCTNCPNPTVTISQSIVYTVTVSNSFGSEGCLEVLTLPVHSAPIIEIEETVDTFTCGEPILIWATPNVSATLQWYDSQGNPLSPGSLQEVNPTLEETYFVVATDAEGCTETDTVEVANRQLDLLLDGQGVIDTCPMTEYEICVTNLDPTDMLTYEWSPSAGGQIISGGDTPCPTVHTDAGATRFYVEVANQWGCKTLDSIEITTFTFNPVLRDVISICPGVPTNINPEANASNLSYFWSPATGLDNPFSPNPQATLFANQLYQVTIQGYNQDDTCSIVKTVQVKVNPLIELATSPPDTSICEPVDVTMSAVVSSAIVESYVWSQNADFSNPLGNQPTLTVTPENTQTYYVLATDTLGCKDTATVNIYAYPINVLLDDSFIFCENRDSSIEILVTNNDLAQDLDFDWEPMEYIEEVFQNGIRIIVDVPDSTEFVAYVVNQFGCRDTISTMVFHYDIEPTVGQPTADEDTIIFNSNEFAQISFDFFDPSYAYKWVPEDGLDNPNIAEPLATPGDTTHYTVFVTDGGGCVAVRTVTVWVINPECQEPNIFIPTGFSPNGDSENDVLLVRSNIIEELEFAVYNRWGQKVFQTDNQETGWDGTFKGEALTPDTYGWYVKAKCYNGEEFFRKGNVTLLR